MKRFGFIITTAVLFCFVGTTAPAYAQQDQRDENQAKQKEQAQRENDAQCSNHRRVSFAFHPCRSFASWSGMNEKGAFA